MEHTFLPLAWNREPVTAQLAAIGAFGEAMGRRRSVREFSAEPVPLELIDRAIAVAGSAPSGANQQPWRFVVVADPAVKREIRLAAEAEEKENYERRFPPEWLRALAPFGTDWHKEFLEVAPYLIVVFRLDFGFDDASQKVKHYYVSESVGIATGFLLAALHMAGLATLTHTPNPMAFLSRICGRPANERPYLLIPVGYPAADAHVPAINKKPLDEIRVLL
ncbi:MAG: nitroreductase family protein [Bryobacterales bacterium]|nr:nitroreductase family protein [Bryobacterales bacterium]